MDTLRVDICYRPLRIAWLISRGDWEAFRRALRYNHALWGGRFNPILLADNEGDALGMVELFRPDILFPLESEGPAAEFSRRFPHLVPPFDLGRVFYSGSEHRDPWCSALDVENMIGYSRESRDWKYICEQGVTLPAWEQEDPLADALLCQFGGYPEPAEVGTDYLGLVREASGAKELALTAAAPIPGEFVDRFTASSLARFGLERHYSVRQDHDSPGFYVGHAGDMADLTCFWNLRACDVPLMFVDLGHQERYSLIVASWAERARQIANEQRGLLKGSVALWARDESLERARTELPIEQAVLCRVSGETWNGLGVQAPMMYLGRSSALGVVSVSGARRRLSFALADRPFATDPWFGWQYLAASLSLFDGALEDQADTWQVPYVPELNGVISRSMSFGNTKVRCEPGRLAVLIGTGDADCTLWAMPRDQIFGEVFRLAGFESRVSSSGRILQQLLSRLGGLQGARVFKIHGVRRLLKTYGPNASFSRKVALQLIGGRDSSRPDVSFRDYEALAIEPRERGEKLRADLVLGFLVEKELLRIGSDLTCPSCRLTFWCPLDQLGRETRCEMCGAEMAPARQLSTGDPWAYRRSGVLGAEKNAGGAVPVALTLQQLGANLSELEHRNLYSPSLELKAGEGEGWVACEIDLAWLIPRSHPHKAALIIGECKDAGPIDREDIQSLRQVADSVPARRFDVFVLLAQLAPFSDEQIEWARALNSAYQRRTILFSAQELEPSLCYERANPDLGIRRHASRPEDMAEVTARLFFGEP